MSNKPDGVPAFPFLELDQSGAPYHQNPGISMRDHFAGLAMQALVISSIKTMSENGTSPEKFLWGAAGAAYEIADAMLKARES